MLMRHTTHISRILPTRRTARINSHTVIPHLDLIPLPLVVAVAALVDMGIPIRTRDRGSPMQALRVSTLATPIRTTHRHRRRCPVRLSSADRHIDMTTHLHMLLADIVVQVLERVMGRFSHLLYDQLASPRRVRRVQRRNLGIRRHGRTRFLVLAVEVGQEVHEGQ